MFVLRRTAAASLLAALAAISTPDTVRAFTSSPVPVSSAAGTAICRAAPATSTFTPALRTPLAAPTLRTANRRAALAPRMAVDVEVKDMPNSQKQLKISVSADECKNAYEAVLSRLSRQVEIPGFRKGKAPTAMVLNHFGKESIQAEACEKIIGAAVPMALQMKDIRAIGQAQMADETAVAKMLEQFKPGQGVDFEVLVDVWPEAALSGSYTGQTLEAEEEPFEEELILNALSEMRKREAASAVASADTVATVYPSKLDDSAEIQVRPGAIAVVDLVGFKKNADGSKGDKLPDLAIGENVEVVMETGKFFEGFVESIAGLKAGDEAAVPVTFPSNHKVAELRGLEAVFDVTIKALKDSTFPALTEDFAKSIADCAGLDELKERIREGISQESIVSTSKNVNKALENMVVKLVDVEIPETLVDEQTKQKFANMMSDFKSKGMDDEQVKSMINKENYERYKKTSRDNTVRSLRVSLVIGEIAKKEGIKVDASEIESMMASMRAQYAGEDFDEEQAKGRVEAELERTKVLDFLRENNTVNLIEKKEAPAAEEK